jgi:D-methionine transport system ATP-binding protein
MKKKEARQRAAELLETVGMTDKAKAYPAQLSGGQKQRVAIARTLASNPNILLCDEATSALDPQTTASILELLKEINQKYGITIVVITHQMAVVREICRHVAILDQGELVETGEVEGIFDHPKTRAARELLANDSGSDVWPGESRLLQQLNEDRRIRIVFTQNSAFEPVIANTILKFGEPVNILKADTRNIGGIAKGEMILGLPKDAELQEEMIAYFREVGLKIEEVTGDVE